MSLPSGQVKYYDVSLMDQNGKHVTFNDGKLTDSAIEVEVSSLSPFAIVYEKSDDGDDDDDSKDIENVANQKPDGQKPVNPDNTNQGGKPDDAGVQSESGSSASTGDTVPLLPLTGVMLISALAFVSCLLRRKRA